MNILKEILLNKTVYPAVITIVLAQLLKLMIDYYRQNDFDISTLWSPGGMPSSHSASVASLVTSLARYEPNKLSSLSFGSSLVFAIIVMYDAAGIRRSAGRHAIAINRVIDIIRDNKGKKILSNHLTEVLGHTPFEVVMGAVFGFIVTWVICYVLDPIG